MRTWHILLTGAAALIGCGIFFALQNLGDANDYAAVASFFLALITAIGSALSFTRSKAEKKPSARSGHDQVSRRGTTINAGNKIVIIGDHNETHATFGEPPAKGTGHRKAKPTPRR